MPRNRLAHVVLIVGIASAACHSANEPQLTPRVYALKAIDERPVPAVLSASALDTTIVLADTLALDGSGHVAEIRHLRHSVVGTGVQEDSTASRYEYHVSGDSIALSIPCGDSPNLCAHGEIGTMSESSLILVADITPRTGPVLHYALVRSP
jgi:hypothetical protein